MKNTDILVVEDESEVAQSIKRRLEADPDVRVSVESTGYGALCRLGVSVPDAIVLDATLPDLSGLDVCRVLRSRGRTVHLPVIMIGERSLGIGPIDGLERGADDYVAKPFDVRELEARLKAVLRRRHVQRDNPPPDRFKGSHLDANFTDVSVAVDGVDVSLTRREFLLLRFLVHHRNAVLDRQTLLANVWESDSWEGHVVDSAIWKLRTKLKQAGCQIETVVGFGYRFNEPATGQRRKGRVTP